MPSTMGISTEIDMAGVCDAVCCCARTQMSRARVLLRWNPRVMGGARPRDVAALPLPPSPQVTRPPPPAPLLRLGCVQQLAAVVQKGMQAAGENACGGPRSRQLPSQVMMMTSSNSNSREWYHTARYGCCVAEGTEGG